MKGFILIALCLFIFSLPLLAQDESVLAHYGTLKIGGVMQSTFTYNMDTTAIQTAFALKRSRLLFWGTILTDQVKYFIQTEGLLSPYILDTKLIFDGFVPQTSIAIGRFCPAFTHYMPRSTAKLDMINYPILVTLKDSLGNEMAYAMWKQCGVQTTTKTDYIDFNLGVFNGYGSSSTSDNNDAKDALVATTIKAAEFIEFIGYGWFGNMLMADETDLAKNRFGGGAIVNYPLNEQMSVTVKGEYVMGTDGMGEGIDDLKSAGFYGQFGFNVNPQIELLGRFENFDPDADTDYDAMTWITGGANYRIDGDHAKISANYIMKQSEVAEGVDDVMDDQFIMQFQLFF